MLPLNSSLPPLIEEGRNKAPNQTAPLLSPLCTRGSIPPIREAASSGQRIYPQPPINPAAQEGRAHNLSDLVLADLVEAELGQVKDLLCAILHLPRDQQVRNLCKKREQTYTKAPETTGRPCSSSPTEGRSFILIPPGLGGQHLFTVKLSSPDLSVQPLSTSKSSRKVENSRSHPSRTKEFPFFWIRNCLYLRAPCTPGA